MAAFVITIALETLLLRDDQESAGEKESLQIQIKSRKLIKELFRHPDLETTCFYASITILSRLEE
jgi:hypothetical protein